MRILEIIADGNPGGGTHHVMQILRGLREEFSIGLVTQRNSYLAQRAKELGLACFGLEFFRSRFDIAVPFKLHRIVSKFAPHLIHAHGPRAGFFSALVSAGIPTVYTVHGFHFLEKTPVMRWLGSLAERLAIRDSTRTIFVSQYDASLVSNFGILPRKHESSVIYYGITNNLPKLVRGAGKHIGFIGRMEYQKDPFLFLEVMACLPGYTATMVGGGTLEARLRKEVVRRGFSTRVKVLGSLSHEDTLEVLASLSAVVITSRWEGLPILALEAMRAGVPVVSVNMTGISEAIENRTHGLLVNSRSPEELASAVQRVTENDIFREHIIEHARARVKSFFAEERMLAEIKKVYEHTIEEREIRN